MSRLCRCHWFCSTHQTLFGSPSFSKRKVDSRYTTTAMPGHDVQLSDPGIEAAANESDLKSVRKGCRKSWPRLTGRLTKPRNGKWQLCRIYHLHPLYEATQSSACNAAFQLAGAAHICSVSMSQQTLAMLCTICRCTTLAGSTEHWLMW